MFISITKKIWSLFVSFLVWWFAVPRIGPEDKERVHDSKYKLVSFYARKHWKYIVTFLIAFSIFVCMVNYKVPAKSFTVEKVGEARGETFAQVNKELMQRELDWGWLVNDWIWPTRFLDNRANFQLGVLEVTRRNIICLRENLSRQRTTDRMDPLLDEVYSSLSINPKDWIWPMPEWEYRTAIRALKQYCENLNPEEGRVKKSTFFPRADNLRQLLELQASLIGAVNTRLINAPGDIDRVPSEETASDPHTKDDNAQIDVRTNWWLVDDNFYYAKGVAWALYHTFKAIKIDFYDVLKDKNSLQLTDLIISKLGRCLKIDPWYVFNGNPSSVIPLPNYSLNLSGPLNDARQKISSLISALKTG